MRIYYLDEFGHIGPFISRDHEKYNTSPVFGLSGFWLPIEQVKIFSEWFFEYKNNIYERDIEASDKQKFEWEKKGCEIFTSGRVYKTKRIGYTLISQIRKQGGKLFHNGMEKYQDPEHSNPTGLYCNVIMHTIRALEKIARDNDEQYMIVLDEHHNRDELLRVAIRTMNERPNKPHYLIEPPFQVESHLYQTIQAVSYTHLTLPTICSV